MASRQSAYGIAKDLWKPRFPWCLLSVLVCFWVLYPSFFSRQYCIDSRWGLGPLSRLASQALWWCRYQTRFCCFLWYRQGPDPAGRGNLYPLYRYSAEGIMKLLIVVLTLENSLPTPAMDIAPQIMTDRGYFMLNQLGLCSSPVFLQTLGAWFPNERYTLLSSEKSTLDHWPTIQSFFSLAQLRQFLQHSWGNLCRCFEFSRGLVCDTWFKTSCPSIFFLILLAHLN